MADATNSNSAATLLPSTRSRNAPPPNRRVSFDADPPPARLEQTIPLLEDTYDDDDDDTAERQVDMDAARTLMTTFREIWASIHGILLTIVGSALLGAAVGMGTSMFITMTCNRTLYWQLDRLFPVIPRWLYTIARGAIGGTLAGLIIWWFDVAKALKRTNHINGSSGSALLESLLYPSTVVEGSSTSIHSQHVVLTLPMSMAILASSTMALVVIGAAPLGPEFGVLIVARCLAIVAAQIEAVVVQSSTGSSSSSRNSEDGEPPPCQEQVWFDIALAAAVGGIGMPIHVAMLLGPLLVQEVSQRSKIDDSRMLEATRLVNRKSMNSLLLHQTIAVLAAWICSQWILNALLEHGMGIWTLPTPTFISNAPTPDVRPRDWILVAVMGCFCAFIGYIVHTLTSLIERGRHCALSIFVIERTPADTAPVVVAATTIGPLVCAGLLLGLIATIVPIVNHGVFPFWSAESWPLGRQDTVFLASSIDVDGMDYLTRTQWLLIACVRSAEIAMALGLGLLGGSILPMASVGLCIGNVLGGATLWLPTHVVLPSSVAAMSVTMSRAPLTTVLVLIWIGRCPLQVAGPVVVATVVASVLTNALVPQLGNGAEQAESSNDANSDQLERQPSNPDDELLHNVRTAIFGGT